MSKNTQTKGTCQVCLKQHVVKNGQIVRHGWREVGNRRVGDYGNCYHTSSCWGSSNQPLELDCKLTAERIGVLSMELYRVRTRLQELADKPEVLKITQRNYRTREMETLELKREDEFEYNHKTGISYNDYRLRLVGQLERLQKQLQNDMTILAERVGTWERKPLIEVPSTKRVAKLHLRGFWREGQVAGVNLCGSRAYNYVKVTDTDRFDDVTCTRCRKHVERITARNAKREAEAKDTAASA